MITHKRAHRGVTIALWAGVALLAGCQYVRTLIDEGLAAEPASEGEGVAPEEASDSEATRSGSAPAAAPRDTVPDLVIRAFRLVQSGPCTPGKAVYLFEVTVANVGTGASPAVHDRALVQAIDDHGLGWGNGVMLSSIPPGGTQRVTIPVYYLQGNPAHMTSAAPHPFRAIADPLSIVREAIERNNRSGLMNVRAPRGCPSD